MRASAVLLVSLFIISPAIAKTPSECHGALKEMCSDKKGKEKFECMKSNIDKLDEECRKMVNSGKEKFAAVHDHPCMSDMDKCKDGGGGHEKVMKCLLCKRGELSDSCKKHLDDKMKEMPCFEDKMKYCESAKPGPEGFECMKKNIDKLSPACKEKIAKGKKEDL
jgi:hypothetical protein